MDDPNLIQWLVGQAGISGLAAFSLMMLRHSYLSALQREREYAEANREDKRQLIQVLNDNTMALTKLTTLFERRGGEHDGRQ